MKRIFNLNQLGYNLSLTEFSFLTFLKIIFVILFILLNLGLLYSEYLDNKNKEKSEYLKCGASGDTKIILNLLILAAGSYSAYITIINESIDNNILDEYKKKKFSKS
jgi:hypothetical protein